MTQGAPSDLIRTVDDRIADKTGQYANDAPRFKSEQLDIKSKQIIPLTLKGFDPFVIKKLKTGNDERISIHHAAGPIPNGTQDIKMSMLAQEPQYDEEIVSNWMPHLSLSVFGKEEMKPLSAAQVQNKMESGGWMPSYFNNPMQDLDYITLEALARFTICGAIMKAFNTIEVGTHFRPELELLNPTGDEDKDQKTITENQDIITMLTQIDQQVSVSGEDDIDISFTDKIASLISNKNIFNRSALLFGYEKPIEIQGQKYKNIPSSLKFAHARDLGIIKADPRTWRLQGVQYRNAYNMIPAKDMIYLWNPVLSSTARGSWLYGDSMMMPMIDASRTIRKNIGVNFPAMAEAAWSGLSVMVVKPRSLNPQEWQKEYQDLVSRMVRGAPNVVMENPQDVEFNAVDFNPQVLQFVAMTEFLIKYCVATTGLPQTLFYDEAATNMATMKGKIQLATQTVINPIRAMDGRMISDQWYNPFFKQICKTIPKYKDLPNLFRIKMAFSELNIMDFVDKVEAVNAMDARCELKPEAYGRLLDLTNYSQMTKLNAPVQPGGSPGQKMGLSNGDQLHMNIKKGPQGQQEPPQQPKSK